MITRRVFLKGIVATVTSFLPLRGLWAHFFARRVTAAVPMPQQAQVQQPRSYGEGAYGQDVYPQPHMYLPIVKKEGS